MVQWVHFNVIDYRLMKHKNEYKLDSTKLWYNANSFTMRLGPHIPSKQITFLQAVVAYGFTSMVRVVWCEYKNIEKIIAYEKIAGKNLSVHKNVLVKVFKLPTMWFLIVES